MNKTENIFSFNDPNESTGYLLWQVSMQWQRKVKQGLDTLDITHTQFALMAALKWLSISKTEILQNDIAHHANVDRMMTSKVIKTLTAKGLIAVRPFDKDSRARLVQFTEKGDRLFQKALNIIESIENDYFARLGSQKALFKDAMRKLVLG